MRTRVTDIVTMISLTADEHTTAAEFGIVLPQAVHPQAEQAQQLVEEWAVRYGLIQGRHQTNLFRSLAYPILFSRGCTTATLDDLVLFSEWFTYFFLVDDQQDIAVFSGRFPEFNSLQSCICEIVYHRGQNSKESKGLPAAVADLCRRTILRVSDAWWYRFVSHVDLAFSGQRYENLYRTTGSVPPLEEFIEIRRAASTVEMCLDIIEACEGVEIPAAIRYSPACHRYADALTDITTYSNDVLGVERDARNAEPNNLVLVRQHWEGLDRSQAIDAVTKHVADLVAHDNELAGAIVATAEALRFDPETCRQIARAVAAWRAWAWNAAAYYARVGGRLTQMDEAGPLESPEFVQDLLGNPPNHLPLQA
jgi:hypothetical protein